MSDPFYTHTSCVETLAHHGTPAPKAWSELRDRFAGFTAIKNPCRDRLAAEIVAPTGADIGVLRAEALAEQAASSVDTASVTNTVAAAVHSELARLSEPVSQRNYASMAARFDKAADLFTAAAKIVDPDTGADDIIRRSEQARAAWLNAAVLAAELDDLAPILAAAACLCGVDDSIVVLSAEGDVWRLPLCVDTGKVHRRRVWEAWAAVDGRCGRWAALHRLGVKIRADAHPERLTGYQEPQPFSVRWVPGPRGGHVQEFTDPHDAEATGIIGRAKQTMEAVWSSE